MHLKFVVAKILFLTVAKACGLHSSENFGNLTMGILAHKYIYGTTTRLTHMGGALLIALDTIKSNSSILVNRSINFNLQFSYCNKRKVLHKTNDLILSKKVDAIVGDSCSTTSEFAGLLAAEYNVPFITLSPSNSNLDDRTVYDTLTMVKGALDTVGDVIIQTASELRFRNICLYSSSRSFLVFIERGIDVNSKYNNVSITHKVNHLESEDLKPTMIVLKQKCRGTVC